jgi:putative lipoic acid-binding regulatory protein
MSYEVKGASVDEISQEVNRILEAEHRMMQNVISGSTGQYIRLQFDVSACRREQDELLRRMKTSAVLGGVISLGPVELE